MRIAALAVLLCVSGWTQAPKKWTPPRAPDGHPDLQGIWSNATVTPLERPPQFAGKAVLSEEEASEFAKEVVQRNNTDRRARGTEGDVALAYNDFWYDRGTKAIKTHRTSLIIDPPEGRIPPRTEEAQRRMAARAEHRRQHPADGPEDRSLAERCLNWATAGPPMLPSFYNNNYQIMQTPDTVVILNEMIHDARIIPLDGRPHVPGNIRQWLGDSRGHWEGDTLVIETTNFTDKTAFQGSSENMRLVERFTRIDADTLLYEFTVDDPAAFTKPWTAQIPSVRSDGAIYEYACHEGNYAMTGMLSSARAEEK
ncbi:MAG TPA: hypothetical protein VKT49_00205 [Bryobacteraceae bacterium]|nr:hypothetical protein [Bryobacteraceae bacterium]